ncbi:helix-turn-helix domain-containing protein [Streptomyces spectabilis]|uniref:winged helix-turn-helix transcriptional regulator n=1 Tax=Streptomyces spectabilis TaxID=68270 RepID=UPI0033DCADCE
MRKTDFSEAACPIARSLGVVGQWWSLLIVRDAFAGARRFGEFQRSLGCPKNMLSTRLAGLVEAGVLRTVPASDGSQYHEYELTEKGEGLRVVLIALGQWGAENLFDGGKEWLSAVDKQTGRPVAPLEIRAEDGRLLDPHDVAVRQGNPQVKPLEGATE